MEFQLPENLPIEALDEPIQPETLLTEFRERSVALDGRLDTLLELIGQIRTELQSESQRSLSQLARAAHDMANGVVYQQIDIQAKGELGALVMSINQTLTNLQQLDASVKQQSTQVPELAAQLDAITADTEEATQGVMNRLDALMNAADEAAKTLTQVDGQLKANQEAQARFQAQIDQYLERAQGGEDPARVAQEILDFLFEHQMNTKLPDVDLSKPHEGMKVISDEAFEILNTMQFQDITRQKVEKVVLLLKQFQGGLARLLAIFKIEGVDDLPHTEVFDHRTVATQENIFDTSLHADDKKASVEDIIAQFKANQG